MVSRRRDVALVVTGAPERKRRVRGLRLLIMVPGVPLPPEIQLAQRLAGNEQVTRDRAVRKLRKYIMARTQRTAGTGRAGWEPPPRGPHGAGFAGGSPGSGRPRRNARFSFLRSLLVLFGPYQCSVYLTEWPRASQNIAFC